MGVKKEGHIVIIFNENRNNNFVFRVRILCQCRYKCCILLCIYRHELALKIMKLKKNSGPKGMSEHQLFLYQVAYDC